MIILTSIISNYLEAWGRNLSLTPSHTSMMIAFLLLIFLNHLNKRLSRDFSRSRIYFESLLIIVVSFLEIYSVSTADSSLAWMIRSEANIIFSIFVIIFLFNIVADHYYGLISLLRMLGESGSFQNRYDIGIKSLIVAYVFYLLRDFTNLNELVFPVVGGIQLWVIGYSFYSVIRNDGRIVDALSSIVLYIIGFAGLFFIFDRYIIPMVLFLFLTKSATYNVSSGNTRKKRSKGSEIELENGAVLHDVGDVHHGDDGHIYRHAGNGDYVQVD